MGIVVLVLLAALLVAGLWLLVAGLRGDRVPEHAVCRACRFDLSGVEPVKCSECGVDLTAPKAVAVVRRRRNPRRAWAGGALALLAIAAPASLLIDAAISGRLSSHLPTPVLALEMQLLGEGTPAGVSKELFKRAAAGEVSDSTLRTVAIAITRMRSGVRGDGALEPALNGLVGDAAGKGLISKDLLAEHVVVPRLLEARTRERVSEGEPVLLGLVNYGDINRMPLDGVWIVSRRIVAVEVGGKVTPSAPASATQGEWISSYFATPASVVSVVRPGTVGSAAVPVVPALGPGRHRMRLHFRVEVFNGRGDTAPGSFDTSSEVDVEVVPKGQPTVPLSDDEELARAVKGLISLSLYRNPGGLNWSVGSGNGAGLYKRPAGFPEPQRLGGAWDIVFSVDGSEQKVGSVKLNWTSDGPKIHTWYRSGINGADGAARLNARLVPNTGLAAERPAIDVMPAGEILYENLPVR